MKLSKTYRALSLFLVLVLIVSSIPVNVSAAADSQRSSAYLDSYNAYIYDYGSGHFEVWFSVIGMARMEQIGALNIILKESSDNGATWHTVKTYRYTAYPTMMGTNRFTYLSCVEYTGTVGYKYFAYVTIWAGRDGGGDSREITTSPVRLTQAGQG